MSVPAGGLLRPVADRWSRAWTTIGSTGPLRPWAGVRSDLALACLGLVATQLRVVQAAGGWPHARVWLLVAVGVAPAALAVRRVFPIVATLVMVTGALLSLLLGQVAWPLLAGSALALWSVGARRRTAPMLTAGILLVGLVPWLAGKQWNVLLLLGYTNVYSTALADGLTFIYIPTLDVPLPDFIQTTRWPWWVVLVWAAAWSLGWFSGRGSGRQAGTDGADRRVPGTDGLAALVSRETWWTSALIALLGCTLLLIDIRHGVYHPEIAQRLESDWRWWLQPGWIYLVAYAPLSLALLRSRPVVPCVVLAVAAFLLHRQSGEHWAVLAVLALALFGLAVSRPLDLALSVAGAILVALPIAGALDKDVFQRQWPLPVAEEIRQWRWPVSLSLILALPVCLGVLIRLYRRNREAAAREAALTQLTTEQRETQTVLTERSHIARDLHDVIAHHVNLMVIQAEAGPDLLRRGEADALQGFRRIGDSGRRALGELDRMLSALRDPGGVADPDLTPQPGLWDLHGLATDVTTQGTPVRLEVRGDPADVPDGVQLTAYRIVQEALTNVVRHAGASGAQVRVDVQVNGIAVKVDDDGLGFEPELVRRAGRHGLTGMRERVRIDGGTLVVASRPGGGTAVAAWLPLTGTA